MSVKIVNVKISMPSSGGGGSSTIKPVVPPEPELSWYNKVTGVVDCSFGLIECNEEVIECL